MSTKYLGSSFDFHGGGSDLIFPHHENEIAQSEGATCCHPFVRYWVHNGFITINVIYCCINSCLLVLWNS